MSKRHFVSVVVLLGGFALAQPDLCDPELVKGNIGPLGYRYRDDRCEGLYARDVSGTTLHVAAVLKSMGELAPDSTKPLTVEWTMPPMAVEPKGVVRLRAESLRYRAYYRMDAARPTNSSSFTWPSNIVSSLRLERREFGVTATVRAEIEKTKRDVYLPVKFQQTVPGAATDGIRLVVVPEAELREVYLTVAPSDPTHQAPYIKNQEPLMFGYYPSGRPIVIPIKPLAAGSYRVQVGATLRDGGSATTELWIHHALD